MDSQSTADFRKIPGHGYQKSFGIITPISLDEENILLIS